MTNFKNAPKIFQVDVTEKIKIHIDTDYFDRIDPKELTMKVEPMPNQINCETTGTILGYRDLVNMDEPVWTNSMCNKLGCLSQGWGKHAGTDIIELIFHKYKPKDRS